MSIISIWYNIDSLQNIFFITIINYAMIIHNYFLQIKKKYKFRCKLNIADT